MNDRNVPAEDAETNIKLLWLLGFISSLCYFALYLLSQQFKLSVPVTERPTLVMLGLLAAAYLCNWLAIPLAIRLPETKRLGLGILLSSALFRLVLLPSTPMHEIDIYRYVWDGAVTSQGISPYRYAPKVACEAAELDENLADPKLERLIELCEQSPALSESLARIHYAYLPSPYPPVSQAVFALADIMTPDSASTFTRLVIMKAVLVLFDLATLLIVIKLLQLVGMHIGWAIVYGWCPLVMKEIANSGHLDSIAIFFTTLAVYLLAKSLPKLSISSALATSFTLALAIAAKLYPVVLLPLFAALWWRKSNLKTAVSGLASTAIFSALLLLPMVIGQNKQKVSPSSADPTSGIQAFLNQWEMNDLLFMVVLENLRPQEDVEPYKKPWFTIAPESWTMAIAQLDLAASPKQTTFLLARIITGGLFAMIAFWLAWRASESDSPEAWCRAAMLTLAWFWLTSPTQNPWYWCWVLPFLPFAKYRTWHLVGAMSLLYYLRFWLESHFPEPTVLGTAYDGKYFFFFIIPWIEFVPCFALLAAEYFWKKSNSS